MINCSFTNHIYNYFNINSWNYIMILRYKLFFSDVFIFYNISQMTVISYVFYESPKDIWDNMKNESFKDIWNKHKYEFLTDIWGSRHLRLSTSETADIWVMKTSETSEIWDNRHLRQQTSEITDIWDNRRLRPPTSEVNLYNLRCLWYF